MAALVAALVVVVVLGFEVTLLVGLGFELDAVLDLGVFFGGTPFLDATGYCLFLVSWICSSCLLWDFVCS